MPQQRQKVEQGSNQFHQQTVENNKGERCRVAASMTTDGYNRSAGTRCWSKLC